jgi:hypothetical protein
MTRAKANFTFMRKSSLSELCRLTIDGGFRSTRHGAANDFSPLFDDFSPGRQAFSDAFHLATAAHLDHRGTAPQWGLIPPTQLGFEAGFGPNLSY